MYRMLSRRTSGQRCQGKLSVLIIIKGFRGKKEYCDGSGGKESACNVGDPGSIPGLGRSPVKGMATHSSVLGIPWTEEPGRLQSMRSQRVRHNGAANTKDVLTSRFLVRNF